MKYALLLALFVAFPAAAAADCAHDWLACPADSQLKINGFSIRAAETIGAITASRLAAVKRLQDKLITAPQAQYHQNKADHARALWQQARNACHENAAGDCRTRADTLKAFALLTSAQRAVE